MKAYLHKTYNEYGDIFASFSLSLFAQQKGIVDYSPECYTTLTSFPEAIHDAYSGLIAEGEEVICYRHTLNNLRTILREKYNKHIEIVHRPFEIKGKKTKTKGYYFTCIEGHTLYTDFENINEDYNIALESGLEFLFNLIEV